MTVEKVNDGDAQAEEYPYPEPLSALRDDRARIERILDRLEITEDLPNEPTSRVSSFERRPYTMMSCNGLFSPLLLVVLTKERKSGWPLNETNFVKPWTTSITAPSI